MKALLTWSGAIALAMVLFNQRRILMKQSEVATHLNALAGVMDQINAEVTGLQSAVQELKNEIANSDGDVSEDLQTALDTVEQKANAVAALVPQSTTVTQVPTTDASGQATTTDVASQPAAGGSPESSAPNASTDTSLD